MALTRDHIINSVHNHLDLPKNRSAEVVESVLEIMKKTLENGEDVLISGFGEFCVRDKAELVVTGIHLRSHYDRIGSSRKPGRNRAA